MIVRDGRRLRGYGAEPFTPTISSAAGLRYVSSDQPCSAGEDRINVGTKSEACVTVQATQGYSWKCWDGSWQINCPPRPSGTVPTTPRPSGTVPTTLWQTATALGPLPWLILGGGAVLGAAVMHFSMRKR